MARYDYHCGVCDRIVELTMPIAARDDARCPVCGEQVTRLFSPPTGRSNLTELRDFPMVRDDIDGIPRQFSSKRAYAEHIRRYNDSMIARGRENWVCTSPVFDQGG
jgi:putative FmdB family regulatory protein